PATAHANLTVIQASTTTTLGAPATVMAPGQEVTFTATVKPTAPGGGTPTGSVTFLNRTTSLGTVSLDSSGAATFTTSGLPAGAQAITAVYGGDSNFTGSQGTATQTVLNKGVHGPFASTLYIIGAAASDSILIGPIGKRIDGTTGVQVAARIGGVLKVK